MKTLLQSVTKPEEKKANQQTLYFTLFTNLDSQRAVLSGNHQNRALYTMEHYIVDKNI